MGVSLVSDKALETGAEKLGGNLREKLGKNGEDIAKNGLKLLGERLGERLGKHLGNRLIVGFALLGGLIAIGLIGSALITARATPSIKYDAPPSPIASNRAASSLKETKDDAAPSIIEASSKSSAEPRSKNAHNNISPRAQKP